MTRHARTTGFTIVEILVVIGIIGLLISLITVGLQRAIETGKKAKDQSRARQLLVAWQQYANNNNDQCMPGFLTPEVQTAWKVKFQNQNGQQVAPELAQTYGWRLAAFLGYEYDPFLGYRDTAETNLDESLYYNDAEYDTPLPASLSGLTGLTGAGLALQPGFGYNAYYVGGWWTLDTSTNLPVYRFRDAIYQDNALNVKGKVVARTVGQIGRSSELLVFSSAALRAPGIYIDDSDNFPGIPWCAPPFLGATDVWQPGGGNLQGVDVAALARRDALSAVVSPAPLPLPTMAGGLEVLTAEAAPLMRYGATVTVANADGSVELLALRDLYDMRRWANPANTPNWTHGD